MNIAIIPARGGSKRIKDKNVKDFLGKPMISYSIDAAIKSKIFDEIIVSTDSKKIAEVAKNYGASTPAFRPDELSDDYASTDSVLRYEVELLCNKININFSVCCIYATAPFITHTDLINSYNIFSEDKWDYVFSATKFNYPIQRAFMKLDNNGIEMFEPKNYDVRSQDLIDAYHDAGQFYWGKPSAWIKNKKTFGSNSSIYEIPIWRVQDIDTNEDWIRAEMLMKSFNSD